MANPWQPGQRARGLLHSRYLEGARRLKVGLKDGAEHVISIKGLADKEMPTATLRESRAGRVIAEETSRGDSSR